ncbi:Stp1/IreP family PP2C-type Ser/Thr phosphatase [Ectothiorhodospira lacustris]|uniref:Stp1/IreP family PP2C-type Ser/Thr phosphatase n=1 Tax=Ectothiorhodospira lacustris TaxID=2899127 RepID=UPI001EE9372E|nr:Stp1/IreP family PP2C-type Ser/Thr phosphatase [Ectothiorhodospira lacustris]MCG5499598.1 Stp1/IreP family PP2C-type Ser/Thr phosphatase [Ectothiorhodospira lacustris]MCG5508708.1 Stp1/IreP family PP2C-type Ser/Thr phosphatase [Ectothiorhodospira lacustris]MCG5520499.1 Stp1/IreP family PP2C-type Ser/Thr phosphatase [Ectothiorhodospira lacustris]
MHSSETLQIVGRTHPGKIRPHNEDCIGEDPQLGIVVVADGMGGHLAGEVASRLAVDTVLQNLKQCLKKTAPDHRTGDTVALDRSLAVRRAIINANMAIQQAGRDHAGHAGMGTTLVMALFNHHRVILAHVGDSRIYRFREDRLEQMTTDHTLIQEMVDRGFYSHQEARVSVNRNLVTRALGIDSTVAVDIRDEMVLPGDIYLLCSDGLNDMLEDAFIEDVLRQHPSDLGQAADLLVQKANEHGGRDNISVVLAKPALPLTRRMPWYRRVIKFWR